MWNSVRRAYIRLQENVTGFALIEIVVAVWLCVKFVVLVFRVLKHFGNS